MPDLAPNRAVAALLAFVAPPGVGHAYLGLPVRGAIWAGVCLVFGLAVPAALGGALGGGATLVLVMLGVVLPWVGPTADVLFLPRSRFRETQMTPLILLLVGGAVAALVTLVARRVFFVEAFKIPAGSMTPTLLIGDHIFVDKHIYRSRAPRRGEVMVFDFPEHPGQAFIKRVVALPGDTLEVKDGHPTVNGWVVPHCKVGRWSYADSEMSGLRHEGELDVEFLGEQAYLTFFDASSGRLPGEAQGPYHAKPGEYWVMGDNRNNSYDSRMWFGGAGGGVPRELVRGHALMVWLSVGQTGIDHSRTWLSVQDVVLPRGAESLQPALDACMKSRPPPSQTTPPSPSP
jgi:signal peptidase I